MSRRTDDDDSGEYQRHRKGGSLLWLWLTLVTVGCVLVYGCAVVIGPMFFAAGRAVASVAGVAEPERVAGGWEVPIEAKKEHRIGDVGITVLECAERHVRSTSPAGFAVNSNHPLLVIPLALKNYNPAKNARPRGQTDLATVTDDLGNVLEHAKMVNEFGFACHPEGQISEGKVLVLRSDEGGGSDAIIVSRPPPAAKFVTVKMRGSCYEGGRGLLVLKMKIVRPTDPGFGVPKHPRGQLEKSLLGKIGVDVRSQHGDPQGEQKLPFGEHEYRYRYMVEDELETITVVRFGSDGKVKKVYYE